MLVFAFHIKPGKPAIDVMLTILAVVVASATLQASGGLDVMLQIAENFKTQSQIFNNISAFCNLLFDYTLWNRTCGLYYYAYYL